MKKYPKHVNTIHHFISHLGGIKFTHPKPEGTRHTLSTASQQAYTVYYPENKKGKGSQTITAIKFYARTTSLIVSNSLYCKMERDRVKYTRETVCTPGGLHSEG